VLGFQGTTAMTVHVIIGAAVAILAAIELWMMSQVPPRLTTGR
jgi:SPW repeat